MKTIQEMKLRFKQQLDQRESDTAALAYLLCQEWSEALDAKMEAVFQLKEPRADTTVFANALSASHNHRHLPEWATALERARDRVIAIFEERGFEAYHVQTGNVTGITVHWGE